MRRRGFTLVELLVVIGIIALLISILMPALKRTKEAASRLKCASNLKQICLAMVTYSQQEKTGLYIYRTGPEGDSLLPLFRAKLLNNPDVAICPSTFNMIRRNVYHSAGGLLDLDSNAQNASQVNGHSYEMRSWVWGGYTWPNGKKFDTDMTKTTKIIRNPADVCLIMDSDDAAAPAEINNWPDPANNHGDEGVNVGYCDGHVAFAKTGKELLKAYMDGYYYPNIPASIQDRWLSNSGSVLKWK